MSFRAPRTLLAALLTAVALIVPSVAWYVVGTRSLERWATDEEAAPRRLASETASTLAAQLGSRLAALREKESRRPYYHYQNLFHDPAGASEGPFVVPSPLARGPDDPLVLGYFQVDANGRLTLPTLNEDVPDPRLQNDRAHQQELRRTFASAVPAFVSAIRAEPRGPVAKTAPRPDDRLAAGESANVRQVELLDRSAYSQNQQASQIFSQLSKAKVTKAPEPARPSVSPSPAQARPVEIELGSFRWLSLTLGATRTLVGLRIVHTPEARLAQAFVIDAAELSRALASAALPASLVPDGLGTGTDVHAPISDTGWNVAIGLDAPLADARAHVAAARTRFARVFALGMFAAGLAGLCAIGLVWQTERLAHQRARFAAAAAHELRTPLAGLRLYSEMLAEGLGDPERSRTYARAVAIESERLARVVTNVLDVTRLERGTLRLMPSPGDLGAVVRAVVERQRPLLESAGASVELEMPAGLPQARFDRDAVHQILQNLLDNAERYSRGAEDRRIAVALAARPASLALTVADRGPGLAAKASDGAGLGLGLVLVRALARAQGGSAECADQPGGGALVTVEFPLAA